MKLIINETYITAKIQQVNKKVFRHVVSDLPHIKLSIDCTMTRADYDTLLDWSRKDKTYLISFDEDLVPLGVSEFIPPFEACTIYANGRYDGILYHVDLILAQL